LNGKLEVINYALLNFFLNSISSTKLDLQKKSEALENIKQVLTKQEEGKKNP